MKKLSDKGIPLKQCKACNTEYYLYCRECRDNNPYFLATNSTKERFREYYNFKFKAIFEGTYDENLDIFRKDEDILMIS